MALFEKAWNIVKVNEGGLSMNAADRGNYNSNNELVGTNFGVSAPVYEQYFGKVPTAYDMQQLTEQQAKQIAKSLYWDNYGLSKIIDQFLANHIFDMVYNSPRMAGIATQKAINEIIPDMVLVDGVIGSKTLAAVNELIRKGYGEQLNKNIIWERQRYYSANSASTFLQGLYNRAESFANYIPDILPGTKLLFIPVIAGLTYLGYKALT